MKNSSSAVQCFCSLAFTDGFFGRTRDAHGGEKPPAPTPDNHQRARTYADRDRGQPFDRCRWTGGGGNVSTGEKEKKKKKKIKPHRVPTESSVRTRNART